MNQITVVPEQKVEQPKEWDFFLGGGGRGFDDFGDEETISRSKMRP
jgi:hypothetical protein